MNKQEYLLTKLAEECVEVAQRCTKALTFGLNEIEPGQELTNAQRIIREYIDLEATIHLCDDNDLFELKAEEGWETAKMNKTAKIKKYMEYSRQQGCLND